MPKDPARGSVFRIGFAVLDRQIVADDGEHVGKTDDVEFSWNEGEAPAMTALLTDTAALGPRITGRLGRMWRAVLARLRPFDHDEPVRIPIGDVEAFSPTTRLSTPAPEGSRAAEKWLGDNVVGRIPGARR
ncbi:MULTISPECIES: hypothetical protein [Nocardiopsis]|uniref:Sporulation protein YlmC with PRC-barrel domain n=1 Tax=Nocardiopsis sinuspersici TaxID=501010 RepID=A0A1V3C4N4_9ACTN|nr:MULTISPECIES: hypothetical protein [Nocardiopsis]NYH51872.1 sporulation protein YlmC with PRC-barrel domain [Nocardiopsis sinuspersici]OOC55449.1 hypothetical protein NOSIN_17865 [Nocardiopsis sinuspersici]